MRWILIMWMFAGSMGGGVTIHQTAFQSKELCEKALEAIKEQPGSTPRGVCVEATK
jgi:hypothetical protein